MDKSAVHKTMDSLSKLLDYETPDKSDTASTFPSTIDNVKRVKNGENVLLYGVPGSGKSWTIANEYCNDEKYMERVVFHPDYTNADFIGQIVPRINKSSNRLEYIFEEGPFTKIIEKSYKDPEHMYYLIIEEINRGNAAAIFGEIFQLLDRDTNGASQYGITNYEIANILFAEETNRLIRIPSNLSLLATMNTSDQNVFTLDTAFQRRWKMRHVDNNINGANHAKKLIDGSLIDWGTFATVINENILRANEGLSSYEDKRLGAYFISERELTADCFSEKVLKYLWDDAFKMNRDFVFASEMRSLDEIINTYKATPEDRLQSVLQPKLYLEMLSRMDNTSTINNDIDLLNHSEPEN